jgi:hypothetical protein
MRIPDTGSKPPPDTNEYLGPPVHKIDHTDAWNVACFRKSDSNLARAYIELRQLAVKVMEGAHTPADNARMRAILHSNDL